MCPFKGLACFEAADAPYFFGRERLIAELVARLVGARLLGVVGPSGSGKSSVVRAGLLPALAGGVLPGSGDWRQVLLRPGEHPLRELRRATADAGTNGRTIIAIDQFEEAFTVCHDEEERDGFIEALIRAARSREPVSVVVAIRADHYGRCAAYPELARLLAGSHVLVGAMQRGELRRVIVGPAQRAGLDVEPELVEALLGDVEDEPGTLPLLSTALLELWQQRDGSRLRHVAYERTGGVRGAVARLAEEAHDELALEQRAVMRSVLLRLVAEGPDGTVERRRVPLDELDPDRSHDVARVIDLLTERRLLTAGAGAAEIAHEALLREWPRLREWIDEDREGLRIHRGLTAAAYEWRRLDRDPEALYRGTRLGEAVEWRAAYKPSLSEREREFLAAGEARRQRERAAHRRRTRLTITALAVGLVVVSIAAGVAISQRERVSEQRNVALSRQLAANANARLTSNPALSLQLALRAYAVKSTPEAEAVLRQATWGFRAVAAARRHGRAVSVAVAPGGRRIASAGYDGRVIIWSWPRFRPVVVAKGPRSKLWGLAFSPDGKQLATGGSDGAIRVGSTTDAVATARVIGRRTAPVQAIAFSPDGQSVASASEDGSVVSWPIGGGAPAVYHAAGGAKMYAVAISPDGRFLAAGDRDGTVRVWETAERSLRREIAVGTPIYQLAFSGDASRLAAASDDGAIRIWGLGDERHPPVVLRADREPAYTVAFAPDSERVAAAGESGTVRVWTARGDLLQEMTGQEGRTQALAWLPDGRHVASAGQDGTTWVWQPAMPTVLRTDDNPVLAVAFSRDGHVATGSVGGAVRWWDAGSGRSKIIARVPPAALGVDVGANGRVAVGGDDGTVLLADKNGRTERLAHGTQPVFRVRFNREGSRLATANLGGAVRLYSLDQGDKSRVVARHDEVVHSVEFSPDSSALASTGQDGLVRVTSLAGGKPTAFRGQAENVYSIAFSPTGQALVGAGSDGSVTFWTRSGRQLGVFQEHTGAAIDAAMTADRTLVSGGADGSVRVWSPAARKAIGLGATSVVLHDSDAELNDLAVASDGRIATAGGDGVTMVWRCEVCGPVASVLRLARRRATPPLNPSEQRILRQGAE